MDDLYSAEEKMVEAFCTYSFASLDQNECEAVLDRISKLEEENLRSEWLWIFLFLAVEWILFLWLAVPGEF